MTRFRNALIYFVAFVLVVGGAMVVIGRTIVDPVSGSQSKYVAMFTDSSGLYKGSSVRLAGVQVGKVDQVEVEGNLSKVSFTVQDSHAPNANSEFAIRYQNLVGQRYLEVILSDEPADKQRSSDVIGTARTISSFDITELFNGIAPLIGDLDPAEINEFADNISRVLQGDEGGLAPAIESISRIASFASDRDELIIHMIDNLNRTAAQINGRSGQVAKLMTQLNSSIVQFTGRISMVQESLDEGEAVLIPFVDILDTLIGALDNNEAALMGLANRLVPATPKIIEIVKKIPGLLDKFTKALPDAPEPDLVCSNGRMDLSDTVQVLIGGEKVVVCQ